MPRKKQAADPALMREFGRQVKAKRRDMEFLNDAEGEISMSAAIKELVAPFIEDAADYKTFSGLVALACVAWNTSLFPRERQDQILSEMMDAAPGGAEEQSEIFNLLCELMERKRKLFPAVARFIVEHKVTDRGGDFHIAVASTLQKQDAQE